MLRCYSRVVFHFWVRAAAKLFVESDCQPYKQIRCEACCIDPYTGYEAPNCKQADCEAECEKFVATEAKAVAHAWIDSAPGTQYSSCNQTVRNATGEFVGSFTDVRTIHSCSHSGRVAMQTLPLSIHSSDCTSSMRISSRCIECPDMCLRRVKQVHSWQQLVCCRAVHLHTDHQ